MTAEMVPTMSIDAARRLTERIRLLASSARESIEKLQILVEQAKEGNAHEALGYQSWTAYLADVLGDEPLRLPRDQRQELVGYLSGEGMSTRAIAPIVGAGQRTVARDVASGEPFDSPAGVQNRTPSGGTSVPPVPEQVDRTTGEIVDPPTPSPVTGLDGKTYPRTKPQRTQAFLATPEGAEAVRVMSQPARRKPLPDAWKDAAYDTQKAIERLHRLAVDDRFPQHRKTLSAYSAAELGRIATLLEEIRTRLGDDT